MKATGLILGMAMLLAVAGLGGCGNTPPPPVVDPDTGDRVTRVKPKDLGEIEVAQTMLDAKAVYEYRLDLLAEYYRLKGNYAKTQWARQEKANLKRAMTFKYVGLTPAAVEPGPALDEAGETTLAEMVVDARRTWLQRVVALRDYYKSTNQKLNTRLADSIRYRFDPVRAHEFFLDVEVAPADLKGVEVIPEAEALFAEAHGRYTRAALLAPMYDYRGMRAALEKFQGLIRQYPGSTKIAPSAFYIAQIYEDLGKNFRAMQWYERAWQWDPYLAKPARYQAAVIADRRLQHHGKALELYRAAVEHETFAPRNVDAAQRRIAELMADPAITQGQ